MKIKGNNVWFYQIQLHIYRRWKEMNILGKHNKLIISLRYYMLEFSILVKEGIAEFMYRWVLQRGKWSWWAFLNPELRLEMLWRVAGSMTRCRSDFRRPRPKRRRRSFLRSHNIGNLKSMERGKDNLELMATFNSSLLLLILSRTLLIWSS